MPSRRFRRSIMRQQETVDAQEQENGKRGRRRVPFRRGFQRVLSRFRNQTSKRQIDRIQLTSSLQERSELRLVHLRMDDERLHDMLTHELPHQGKITLLNLSNNEIGNAGLKSLAKALPETSVCHLQLRRNGPFGVSGLHALASSSIMQSITILNLSECGLGNQEVSALAQGLITPNCSLEELSLNCNYVEEGGALSLGEAVAQNTSLRVLDIGQNPLRHKGFHGFATAALIQNRSLQRLYVNDIGIPRGHADDCVEVCITLLQQHNASLTSVAINGWPIENGNMELERLDYWLTLNGSGRSFLRQYPHGTLTPWIYAKVAVDEDPSLLYGFLRDVPPSR